ncbi:unnamed protein product [Soboliphyme baturini]|uniref:BPI2 domain-containing protein n=1 Tax=Soboliphyme baturini TaxID=241478 RepID=A0A183IGS4_9BILA|nr:unnamed protein product [Soboliphyme baturini]
MQHPRGALLLLTAPFRCTFRRGRIGLIQLLLAVSTCYVLGFFLLPPLRKSLISDVSPTSPCSSPSTTMRDCRNEEFSFSLTADLVDLLTVKSRLQLESVTQVDASLSWLALIAVLKALNLTVTSVDNFDLSVDGTVDLSPFTMQRNVPSQLILRRQKLNSVEVGHLLPNCGMKTHCPHASVTVVIDSGQSSNNDVSICINEHM